MNLQKVLAVFDTLAYHIVVGNNIKFLGTSGDITTCELCGKSNLKKTVALEIDDQIKHYGVDCAGAVLYGRKTASNTNAVRLKLPLLEYIEKVRATGGDVKRVCEMQGFWREVNHMVRGDGLKVAL